MGKPIELEIDLGTTVNYALQQNEVAVLRSIKVINTREEALYDLEISVATEPEFAENWSARIDQLREKEVRVISPVDIRLSSKFLWQVQERLAGSLCVEVSIKGEVIAREVRTLEVLAHDEWPGLRTLPEILAAFVLPNVPAVEGLLSKASTYLREWTGDGAISGYQSKDRGRILYMGAAIFSALQSLGLNYSNPPASFELQGQKIRLPDRIVSNRLGSCLDLSTFYAACLEQAGLNPLVIFTEGHAFPGFWLIEESFQTCNVEDPMALKKRADLGELCLVEATLVTQLPPVSFNQAAAVCKQRLSNPADFVCAIDIQRARKSHIRPLPLSLTEGQEAEPVQDRDEETPPEGLAAPSIESILETTESEEQTPKVEDAETPSTRLERWKRKLLDLSLRNRLINFKESKRKTLPLLTPDLSSLEDALADGEKFQIMPRLDQIGDSGIRSQSLYAARHGGGEMAGELHDEFAARRLHAAVGKDDLDRRLLEMYRAGKTALEEGGASALYLALGFLEWYEAETSQQRRRAPILLIPLTIERRSVQEGFRLYESDDEPMVNTTLLEKLRVDFDVQIPGVDPIPTDEHGVNVNAILRYFREAIKNVPRWDVVEEAQIGFFSFSKFLMWKDLQVRSGDLMRNGVVSHLVDSPDMPFPDDRKFPDIEHLDESHPPANTYCPLDCDSSQLAAIYAAADKRSFVLEGPPGTGKSQTITNMIAHCLAKGQTVLFVSEKMAALNVVYSRLSKVGLADFCLELHSTKARKRRVVEQLANSFRAASARTSEEWTTLSKELGELRNDLNGYVESMHRRRSTGESLFYGYSQLALLRDAPLVDLGWPNEFSIGKEGLERIKALAARLQLAGNECGHPYKNTWAASSINTWSPVAQREIRTAADRARKAIDTLKGSAGKTGDILQLGKGGWSSVQLKQMYEVSTLLMNSPSPPAALLTSQDWNATKESLSDWIVQGRRRDTLREEVFAKYNDGIMRIDLQDLEARCAARETSWGPVKWIKGFSIKRILKPVLQPGQRVPLEFVRSEIEKVEALKKEEYLLNRAGEEARQLLGAILWKDGQADWSRLEQLRAWSDTFVRTAAQIAGVDLERMRVLRETWSRLLTEGDAARGPDGAVYRVLGEYCSTYEDFLDSIREVEAKATLDPAQAWSDPALSDFLDDTSNRLQGFIDDLPALQAWCNWRRVREDALKLNLNAIVSAYEDGQFPTSEVERVVLRAFYEWWVDGIVEAEPVLRDFFGPEHDRKIAVFRELDTQYTELSKQQIRAFLSSKVPSIRGEVADTSEVGILLRQQGRRRGIMPIRKLFQKIPNLLWRLKPCLLMSPLSVAQYLDPSYPQFDLVVFDEASQIPVWDAVGAIARGKEVIVVGDSKQLPPTSFFNRSDDPEDFEDESAVDLESILDDCVAARLPCHELDWHYRSRHESLISFSNHQYYGNRLLTFPSPHREIGVSWKPVPGGVYDRAGARVNKAEAEAIVSEVRRRLLDQEASKFTIGIVTFSIAQQRLIEDLLDAERRKEPEIDPFFSDDLAEPVFVKNLENVQGDERDVILFSICYGPDVTGRVAMNFGPLNKEGGERRLNVAITRARRELLVFSTLRADQIDLSRTRARGVWDLKKFLDYAERGEAALLEASGPSENADFESPFEKDVCEALRSRGYEVHLQVGCSGYRIDLAVVDPDKPGHYLLGVECDGASYHSAKTARDRDRLRQAVLSDLGWHLFRVWSSDWWNNREATLSKIEAAIEAAKVEEPISPAPEPQGSLFAAAPRLLENPVKGFDERQLSTVPRFDESEPIEDAARRPYELCSPLPTIGQKNDFYKVRSNSAMTEAIKYVVRKEGPINLELCARKVIECWGLKRLTPAVLDRIRERIPSQVVRSQVCSYGTFLWPKEMVANDLKCYRAPESPGDFTRSAEEIPPEEVANAAAEVLAHQVAMPMSSLVKETSLLFGFKRVGPIVDHVMEEGIQLLLSSGRAVHNGENIISV